jgi:hypothetical protein
VVFISSASVELSEIEEVILYREAADCFSIAAPPSAGSPAMKK